MRSLSRTIAALLLGPLLLLSCPVEAALAPEPDEAPPPQAAEATRAAGKLQAAGLAPEEAAARVAAMSPAEVAHAARSDVGIRRGGDGLAILLALFLMIAVLYYVTDHEDRHHHEKR